MQLKQCLGEKIRTLNACIIKKNDFKQRIKGINIDEEK